MRVRKIIGLLVVAACLTVVTPALALNETPKANTETPAKDSRAQQLNRLKEIRDMDKSNLTASEKRALRKEVRHIRKDNSRGIYLSIGAIVIIAVLLILLLS
jgi:hypothetical protein